MNNIRAIQALNERELAAGISTTASWHTDFADTAYIYIGGLPYELSEGDIVTIFSQYGEPVHVSLIRDKETGKSKGFAFLKYEDQRSTNLAVDNLGGTTILGRVIRVDHTRYKQKDGDGAEEGLTRRVEDEEEDDGRERRDRRDREKKRRRREEDEEPEEELLKEEIELQRLIRDHDEDDPMKEYLIRQKKEDLAIALEARKKEKSRLKRGDKEKDREHRHRDRHRHRSRSKERRQRKEQGLEEREERRRRDRSEERDKGDREGGRERRKHRDRDLDRDHEYKDRERDREHSKREKDGSRHTSDDGHSRRERRRDESR
ncbi:RNA-binding protein Cwf29 [Rhizina undulata]